MKSLGWKLVTSRKHVLHIVLNPWEMDLSSFPPLKEQLSTFKKSDNCNQLLVFPWAERQFWKRGKWKTEAIEIRKQCNALPAKTWCPVQESAVRSEYPDSVTGVSGRGHCWGHSVHVQCCRSESSFLAASTLSQGVGGLRLPRTLYRSCIRADHDCTVLRTDFLPL